MSDRHLAHWPPGLSRHLTLPQTNLFHNAEVSAARYPDKPFLVFYDTLVTFRQFQQQAEHIAGFLQQVCGRMLRYLTRRVCPNAAAQQRSELCGAPRKRPAAGLPRSNAKGSQTAGSPFFWVLFFGEAKNKYLARRGETRPSPLRAQQTL